MRSSPKPDDGMRGSPHRTRSALPAISRVLCALTLALLAAAAGAQPVPRIGILSPFSSSADGFRDGFERRLAELGYARGRNIALEYRASEGMAYRLPALADQLMASKVSLIVTTTAAGAQAARQAGTQIPIVLAGVDDAVEQGFVQSLARPGGNVTGVSWLNTELSAKRVELVKQALPRTTRIAYLREAAGGASALRAVERAARTLGMRLVVMELRVPAEIDAVFDALARERVSAVVVAQGPMMTSEEARIAQVAARHRLPTVFPFRGAVEAGGFMSYGPKPLELYRRAADYADRILKGARPGELPVEQPTSFELVVNATTARTLGVRLPESLMVNVDELIR
jgi:ABC-type uncharacterized transport system substrate-binding protein